MKTWWVYIIQNQKGVLYTGITTECSTRISAHNNGCGAKFTRGKGPWHLVASLEVPTRSEASKIEAAIKKLPKDKKVVELLLRRDLISRNTSL